MTVYMQPDILGKTVLRLAILVIEVCPVNVRVLIIERRFHAKNTSNRITFLVVLSVRRL